MKLSSKVQSLTELIEPAVKACGVDLWGIEFQPQGKRSLLRVYIDLAESADIETSTKDIDNKKGVGVDDCKKVSHQVSGVLDVHDPIAGEYVLEVSSPGWDRRFFDVAQMQAYIGENIALRLIVAQANRRKLTAKLLATSEKDITVEFSEKNSKQAPQVLTIATSNIDKANLVFQD